MAKQPFVPVDHVIRVRIPGVWLAGPYVNLFAVQYSGAVVDNTTLDGFATSFRNAWITTFGSIAPTQFTSNNAQCWDLTSQNGSIGSTSASFTGSVPNTTPLPAQSAVVVSWPVQGRWRGGHFRTYMFARNITSITNGKILSQAEKDAYATAALNFRSAVNALTINSVAVKLGGVRYFPTGFNPDGTPITKTSGTFYQFLTPIVHSRLDSQRRRSGKEVT